MSLHGKRFTGEVKGFSRCSVRFMYAHGKADFIAKLQIALKECSESEYWLELLIESGYWGDNAILEQCREVKRILISSINTAKSNQK